MEDAFLNLAFGESLRDAVAQASPNYSEGQMFRYLSAASMHVVINLPVTSEYPEIDGHISIVHAQSTAWHVALVNLDVGEKLHELLEDPDLHEDFWNEVDELLWNKAAEIECADGRLAGLLGLYEPEPEVETEDEDEPPSGTIYIPTVDDNRPVYFLSCFGARIVSAKEAKRKGRKVKPPQRADSAETSTGDESDDEDGPNFEPECSRLNRRSLDVSISVQRSRIAHPTCLPLIDLPMYVWNREDR